jgi:hypothetical protein
MPSQKPLINLIIDEDLLERLEDWRFTRRMPSRAAAIKWLLRWAIARNPDPKKPDD